MNPNPPADQALVRILNLSSVLRLIHYSGVISRAELAARTGLNKSTVSSLVEDLLDRQLIIETGRNLASMGRPATQLEMNPRAGTIVAVSFESDFVSCALINFMGKILWRKQIDFNLAASQEKGLKRTLDLVNESISFSQAIAIPILGISFATPGTVNYDTGVMIFAPNLRWRDVPLRDIFTRATGLEVFMENDANSAAIGEHLFGDAKQLHDFLFVVIGDGLGGGLFLNGQLYRGRHGFAGEIGHTHIMAEPFNVLCGCGNLGCWETYANKEAIYRRVRGRWQPGRPGMVERLMSEQNAPLSLSIINQAADAGDADAIESLVEVGKAIGNGLADLVSIFNPEKVILGGPISIVGKYILPIIRESVNLRSMPANVEQADVSVSVFGRDATLMGAASFVIDKVLNDPTKVEREVVLATI